jgi:hypothetical protein
VVSIAVQNNSENFSRALKTFRRERAKGHARVRNYEAKENKTRKNNPRQKDKQEKRMRMDPDPVGKRHELLFVGLVAGALLFNR